VLPLMQVKEFWPAISMGGGFTSLGHIAMLLSESWPELESTIDDHRQLALYYVGVRGTGAGSVRASLWGNDESNLRYQVSSEDMRGSLSGRLRPPAHPHGAGGSALAGRGSASLRDLPDHGARVLVVSDR
jgi:hypothetical protein